MACRMSSCKRNARWQANVEALGEQVHPSTVLNLRIETLPSMAAAVAIEVKRNNFTGNRISYQKQHIHIQNTAVFGNPKRLALAMASSDELIDGAIAIDPRLAKRCNWTRGEDGIFADAGLVATGDDSPCYEMTKATLNETAAAGEPVIVCVSTDSSQTDPAKAAAFIATVRIVQQFRPVRVYWQGAWLDEDGLEAGYVFHAPLVTNDTDFARCEYVLSDETRDGLSFAVLYMAARVRDKLMTVRGFGRHAGRAYMNGAEFVDKDGISANPSEIARTACRWLGWDTLGDLRWKQEADATGAIMEIPREYKDTRTPAQRAASDRKWRQLCKDEKARTLARNKAQGAERLETIQTE